MEVIGKIIVLNDTELVGSAGTFKKRTVVVQTDEQYKQSIPIDFVQDKCDILNAYKVGEDVKVSINIRGNEYNGKYYVSLNGWRIERIKSDSPQPTAPAIEDDAPDDLPF